MSFVFLLKVLLGFSKTHQHRPSKTWMDSSIGIAWLFGIFFSVPAVAQDVAVFQEQEKLIKAPSAVLKSDVKLFGEKLNLYTGSLEFEHVDVELPGNNKLRVAVGRHISAGNRVANARPFGRWNLDIPYIRATYSAVEGWVTANGDTRRCSSFSGPRMVNGTNGSYWAPQEFWAGIFLHIPGAGDQRMLSRALDNLNAPGNSPSTYPVVTPDQWVFSCLSTLANYSAASNAAGEGFLAVAPDGTKYRFDWMVTYGDITVTKSQQDPIIPSASDPPLSPTSDQGTTGSKNPPDSGETPDALPTSPYNSLARVDVRLLPTTITDRFGNTVTYQYDPNRPGNVTRISSNDGRAITFGYAVPGLPHLISSVSDGTRT